MNQVVTAEMSTEELLHIFATYDINIDDWRCFYFYSFVEDGYHAVPLNG